MIALLAALTTTLSLGIGPDAIDTHKPVADPGGVLSADVREALSKRLYDYQTEHKVQMAIVIVDTLDGRAIEDWGIALFQRWKLGTGGNDDGVLAILVMNDRLSRLEVGYGIEGWIPDATAKPLLDGMRTSLRAGNVGAALDGLIDRVQATLTDYAPGVAPPAKPLGTRPATPLIVTLIGIGAGIFMALLKRRFVPLEKRLAKRAKIDPTLKPVASKVAFARKALPWATWLVVPLVLALIFRRGAGFWYAYPIEFVLWSFCGVAIVYTATRSVAGITVYGLILATLFFFWFSEGLSSPWESGSDMLWSTIGMWVVAMVLWGLGFIIFSKTTAGWSRASPGSSWSSSGGSSWSSSSSSSSSSGGDYSGGGGRSGGGGATSSW